MERVLIVRIINADTLRDLPFFVAYSIEEEELLNMVC